MFLRDKSGLGAAMSRSDLPDDQGLAVVTVEVVVHHHQRYAPDLLPSPAERPPAWPEPIARRGLLAGVSVTANATVEAPARPPYEREIGLSLQDAIERIVVCGRRTWVRGRDGALRMTAPERFEPLALTYDLAFGGAVTVPPGLDPSSGLPRPAALLGYPPNPTGMGFFLDEAGAVGGRLPQIERANERVQQWSDRPMPGGIGPCYELAPLRLRPIARREDMTHDDVMRLHHHAPRPLVASNLAAGARVRLAGCGAAVDFAIPAPPVRVVARNAKRTTELAVSPRAVHVDADRGITLISYGAAVRYRRPVVPSTIHVVHA